MRAVVMLAALSLLSGGCHAGDPDPAVVTRNTPEASQSTATPGAGGILGVATTAMPAPRAAHSATRLADGRVLLAGGCAAVGCEEGISGDAILFDPAANAFVPTGKLRQARVGHRAIALADGSVLLIGGWTADGVTASVERFTPTTGRFEAAGRMLQARDGFSANLLADGSVLIAGGYGDGMRRLASAERYDPATGRSRTIGAMSMERMSHTATALPDGRVLVAGGSRSSQEVVASLEIFNPATDTFSPAGTMARARHKHAAVAVGDRVLLLGGAAIPEASGHFRDSEWWHAGKVVPGPSMAEGRYKFLDAALAWGDGTVLVAGSGRNAELLGAGDDSFNPVEGAFDIKLAFATATLLADGRVLVAGGYDPDIRPSTHAWLLSREPASPERHATLSD